MNLGDWEIESSTIAGSRKILLHKGKLHAKGACVVEVDGRYECWVCGTEVPACMLDVALLAHAYFPPYSQEWLDSARKDRHELQKDMAKCRSTST